MSSNLAPHSHLDAIYILQFYAVHPSGGEVNALKAKANSEGNWVEVMSLIRAGDFLLVGEATAASSGSAAPRTSSTDSPSLHAHEADWLLMERMDGNRLFFQWKCQDG